MNRPLLIGPMRDLLLLFVQSTGVNAYHYFYAFAVQISKWVNEAIIPDIVYYHNMFEIPQFKNFIFGCGGSAIKLVQYDVKENTKLFEFGTYPVKFPKIHSKIGQ
jgi:hypothetical protein